MNPLDAQCSEQRTDAVCVNQLRNARPVDDGLRRQEPDVKVYLPFKLIQWDNQELFETNTYKANLGKNINIHLNCL